MLQNIDFNFLNVCSLEGAKCSEIEDKNTLEHGRLSQFEGTKSYNEEVE